MKGYKRNMLKKTHPILVTGYMNSGTTLLRNIMSNHPLIHGFPHETQYFHHLSLIQNIYPNLDNDQMLKQLINLMVYITKYPINPNNLAPDVENADVVNEIFSSLVDRDYYTVFRHTLDYLALSAGKEYWLEKTPTHIFHVDRIIQNSPDMKIVHIVRDPRDVVASKKTLRSTVWTDRYDKDTQKVKNLALAFDPFWDTLSWKANVQTGLTAYEKYPDNVSIVRYEDLTATPAATTQELLDWIGLEFDDSILDINYRNSAYKSNQKAGIDQTSVGRWKDRISNAEVYVIQKVASAEIQTFQYSVFRVNIFTHLLSILTVLLKSGWNLIVRIYRRWRLGGRQYLIATLQHYSQLFFRLIRSQNPS